MRMTDQAGGAGLLQDFSRDLLSGGTLAALQTGLIGRNASIDGPFGPKPLVYADYVASGRALAQVEHFVMEEVLPFYANSHTEASYCGGFMTRMRREARALIGEFSGATADHAVIFTGSGATSGINRLVKLFGVAEAAAAGLMAPRCANAVDGAQVTSSTITLPHVVRNTWATATEPE